jgi:ABC-type dipeptide/oligopeptide/nickel transport system ATPase component
MTNTEPVESYGKADIQSTIAEKLSNPINIHPADILKKKYPFAFSGGQKGERKTMFA